ncbi:MAG: methyl-accepting chemotaxis protein [Bacillota bacterium]
MKKISAKIWTGFISLLLLMTVLVGYNYYQLNHLKNEIIGYSEKRVPLTLSAERLALSFARQAAGTRGYLATGDQKFIDEFNDAKKIADREIAYLELNVADKDAFDPVRKAVRAYEPHPSAMFTLYKEHSQSSALIYMTTAAAPANARAITEINKYIELMEKSLHEEIVLILNIEKSIQRTSIVLLFTGILLGIAIAYSIARPIKKALDLVGEKSALYAEGDFRESIEVKSSDELGRMAAALNKMRDSFADVVEKLKYSSGQLSESSRDLAAQAQQSSAGAMEVAATVGEIAASVEEVSNNARDVAAFSGEAARQAGLGARGVERITGQMEVIAAASDEASRVIDSLSDTLNRVNQIVDLITNIADQTNLLALNAAIEAARAGEQGRGFAVVAEEVRKLAEQSASAAKDINQLIAAVRVESGKAVEAMGNGNRQVKEGAAVVREVGESFKGIMVSIDNLAKQIQNVASAASQISGGVQNVAGTTEEQTAAMEEVSAATNHLAGMAGDLNQLVARFKI